VEVKTHGLFNGIAKTQWKNEGKKLMGDYGG
jgi:hypothetical protein